MWPINSTLTQDILETDFFESVERAEKARFYTRLSESKTVGEVTTTFPSFGSVPEIRQMSGVSGGGVRQAVPLKDWSVSGTVYEYEQTIPFRRIIAQSKPDAVRAKTRQMASKALKGMDRVLCQALASTTVNGYDAVPLISTTHPESGANQSNDLTGANITTNYIPTGAEAEAMLNSMVGALKAFQDDQGTPTNEGVSRYILLCPVPMEIPFKRIVDPSMVGYAVDSSGGTGVYRGAVEVIASAYCTTTGLTGGAQTVAYLFPQDETGTALARLELADWQFNTNIGDDSSDDWNKGEGYIRSWAAFSYLPWQWQSVVKITVS